MVEDSAIYQHLIGSHLRRWGFEVVAVKGGREAWEILQRPSSPTLVLLDWVMPDMDGLELCRKVRARGSADSHPYMILLTGKDHPGNVLEALEAGADDYLVKPFDELELKGRLLVGRRTIGLHQELVHARESMRFEATHDGLTGLMNRAEIVKVLQRELDRGHREKKPLTLMMAEIDHFNRINDESGHLAGDEVLIEVGKRLRSNLRSYDCVGRYRGEEFLILMPGCDNVSALVRADQILSAVSLSPLVTSAKARTVTLSIGVAVVDSSKAIDVQAALHQAGLGLDKAKRGGRNRVEEVEDRVPSYS